MDQWSKATARPGAAEEARITARGWAAQFFMVREDRINLALLDADGDDQELLQWFGR
jgi:hypothetical protein